MKVFVALQKSDINQFFASTNLRIVLKSYQHVKFEQSMKVETFGKVTKMTHPAFLSRNLTYKSAQKGLIAYRFSP